MTRTFALIAGGGTAGHVLPAIAIAEGLVDAGHELGELHYTGARRGIEVELVPPTGLDHTFFDVVGFQRRLDRANLAFVPKLARSRRGAIALMKQLRPRVVVSVGGYASLPAVLAARRLGVPVVVVSYDRFPGRASALAARRAAACAVAFPDTELPRATVTGAPLRRAILAVDRQRDREAARERLGVPAERFLVAVMGGSQGSGALNEAVGRLLDEEAGDRTLAVRHALGRRFVDSARPPLDGAEGVRYQPVGFEDDMASVYAAADLLVGRGGASTVHEVAATGVPAVLVPWAAAADDHQTANVRWLADVGGAVHLPEVDLPALPAVVRRLRGDVTERAALGTVAHRQGEVHRSGSLSHLIESVALA